MTSSLHLSDRRALVLIVDDERHNRQLLEAMLTTEGYLLKMASTGEEALAVIARRPPDLVLLDIMMPGMDGYQAAAKIKGNPLTKNIPIIMVTALDDRNAKLLGLKAGAEDFLTKPVDRAELCVKVRNLLRLKANSDYHEKYSHVLETEVASRTAELAESERLYRETFDAAPVGILYIGLDGGWLRVNQRLCDLLGYSREDLQSPSAPELTQAEEAPGEADSFRRLAEGAQERHVIDEKRYRRRDGSFLWARVNMSVHRNGDAQPQHVIAVIEDITERRALEAQVRQASKMDAIGSLASGIAHDFNNLLSIVISYSELLCADLKEGDPMREELDEIRGAGLRAAALTSQLLAFSRQEIVQPKVVDLTEIVVGMEKLLRRLIGEDVELVVRCPPALEKIVADPGQMEQVIINLVVNARDAMPRGGKLTIETSMLVLDEGYAPEGIGLRPGPHVLLAVSDTGVGMDKAMQARVFEPFFTTKAVGKGTGLGLATVFGVVQQSGGTIWIDSEPEKGATFKVYFPTADGAAVARAAVTTSQDRTLRGGETVLLVEDDDGVRALARSILLKYGYSVLEAQSGGDACLLCEEHTSTIDLLLTDVVMPRMSGRELAERLMPLRPGMKVLYMSGYMDDAVVRHGVQNATVAFIQKPITPEALARKIRETLHTERTAPNLLSKVNGAPHAESALD